MILTDVPAIFETVKESAAIVEGVKVTVTIEFMDRQIAAVHISPGLKINAENMQAWIALEKLLGLGSLPWRTR